MADIFDVIADPTRRELLRVLLDRSTTPVNDTSERRVGEISVGEIVDTLSLSQPTVSKHLKVLRDHGFVRVREEGQHRFYTLEASPLEALEDWLIPFLTADVREPGSGAFAAWSGAQVPAPLRRVADGVQHPATAGAAVGRRAAEASFQTRSALHEATQGAARRVIDPLKKKLGKK